MSSGLFINPLDGGKMINYAANLKAASYLGNYNPQLDNNGETRTSSSLSNGAQLFVAPRTTGVIVQTGGSSATRAIYCNNLSISGGTVTAYYSGFNRFQDIGARIMSYDTFQIIGSQQQGFGLFLQDSSNFFSITDSATIGQCVYRVAVNINGTFQIPQNIPNISNAIVFASWNRGDRSLYLDRSNMQVRVYSDNGNESSWGGDCYVEIVVMSNIQHTPHNGGLTLYSPQNGQCVFSSRLPPFIYKGIGITLNPNPGLYASPTGAVSRAMVPLCTVGLQKSNSPTGAFWGVFDCGLKMVNNSVTGWRTRGIAGHSTSAASFNDVVTQITLPVIDAADYF